VKSRSGTQAKKRTAKQRKPSAKQRKPTPTREIVQIGTNIKEPANSWSPVVGAETLDLLNHIGLPADGRAEIVAKLRDEALRIFSRCTPPSSQQGSQIGLVIGYVQSGKTMSFTTVAALARDNGYQMVIVIAGTSLPLMWQSTERLEKDLRLNTRKDRKWQHFVNPTSDSSDEPNIRATLEDWSDPDVQPSERRTVLITVMKQHKHLDNLNELLSRLPMVGRPVLVIDDEADQAGLNTWVRRKEESTTYRKLLGLRRLVPHHSYLQYTATPQAPLLINLIDVLSPRFAEMLTPGPDYVGGREFFIDRRGLVRIIPEIEIPSAAQEIDEPPESLILALRLFFLGVAAGVVLEGGAGNRSMLVHPSQRTDSHKLYLGWVRAITNRWSASLELKASAPDRVELIADFKKAYADLKKTASDLPPFSELEKRIKHAIRRTRIEEVNTRVSATPQVSWTSAYPHILVGGQAMDRGFTVEGLTITYMPRGLGVGNADSVQQRARFFGYKRPYLGYCRVFLGSAALTAYKGYVVHEEDVRARLLSHNKTGKPLTEWKREFFLTKALKPTRRSVLGFDYMRIQIGDGWWNQSAPYETEDAVENNRTTIKEFVGSLPLKPDKGHDARTAIMRHKVASEIPLRTAMEDLLTKYTVAAPEDSPVYTTYLLVLREYLERKQNASCDVFLMSGGALRERSIDTNGAILNLFQGPHPDKDGKIYKGDRNIRVRDRITIQIHNLKVFSGENVLATAVPTLALWVPKEIAPDVIIQDQG
jgi:Z1 domain